MNYIKQRIFTIGVSILSIILGVAIILFQLKDNITFFFTPSEIKNYESVENKVIRLGGLVVEGSIKHYNGSTEHIFTITDNKKNVIVHYKGILPKLFRVGQGIVAKGKLQVNGIFEASELLTKHDENYVPKELGKLQDIK
ncbi:Cytochrome C biogenesis protein CcmE [Rickettsiales bacterium Ac37b]|nr:Cytochrome C biogenesis protein CcmE [Rickettsiales bacterium Ac37b]